MYVHLYQIKMDRAVVYLFSCVLILLLKALAVYGTTCYQLSTFGSYYSFYCSTSCCGTTTYRYCCLSYYYTSVYTLSTGAIAGAAVGSVVFIAICVIVIIVICKQCNKSGSRGTVVVPQQGPTVAVVSTGPKPYDQNGPKYPQHQGPSQPPGYNQSMYPGKSQPPV